MSSARRGRGPRGRGRASSRGDQLPFSRESFVKANYSFALNPLTDSRALRARDALDWEDVEAVMVQTNENSSLNCPVCLDVVAVPRCTPYVPFVVVVVVALVFLCPKQFTHFCPFPFLFFLGHPFRADVAIYFVLAACIGSSYMPQKSGSGVPSALLSFAKVRLVASFKFPPNPSQQQARLPISFL